MSSLAAENDFKSASCTLCLGVDASVQQHNESRANRGETKPMVILGQATRIKDNFEKEPQDPNLKTQKSVQPPTYLSVYETRCCRVSLISDSALFYQISGDIEENSLLAGTNEMLLFRSLYDIIFHCAWFGLSSVWWRLKCVLRSLGRTR